MPKKEKILLVDDSPLIQKVGKQILFRKGFDVVLADHGEMALKLFFGQNISLVILDYHMPKLDGLKTLLKIRRSSDLRESKVPVLIMSVEDDPREIGKLLEAGADDFIGKHRLSKTPELFLEKVFSLLKYEREVEHYKKMKLVRMLSAPVKEFYTFVEHCVEDFKAKNPIPFKDVRLQLGKIYDLHHNGEILETVFEVIKPEAYLVTHTVNVCLMTVMFCSYKRMEREKVIDIALGAFFHDFGNVDHGHPMLKNPCKLSDEEFNYYMKHVERSVETAKSLELPNEALDFIENHHERLNGTGFPQKKKEDSLSEIARIASILVTFDSLTSEKAGEKKMVANEALRKMKSWENQFPANLFREFEDFSRQFDLKPKD